MSVETPELIIDIGDPQRQGMYRSFLDEIPISLNRFFEFSGGSYRFRFCRRNQIRSDIGKPFVDVNLTGATVMVGIGERSQAPVAGTWALTYNASGVGLGTLAYDISEIALQTALNANAAVTADGGVTVKKYGAHYIVTFNTVGVKQVFVANVESLQPEMRTTVVTHPVVGDVDTKDVQIFTLRAAPYALAGAGDWTRYFTSGITVTETQAGTTSKKAVRKLEFASQPYGGSFTVNFPKQEVVTITAGANTATKEVFTVTVNSGTFNTTTLNSTWFQVYDDVGPVNIWFNTSGGGVVPAVPSGGRNLVIAILTADTLAAVAAKIATAIDADAKFVATQNTSVITVTASTAGARTAGPIDNNSATGGISLAEITAGADGVLKGTYFALNFSGGTLGIWFSVAGSTIPAGAALTNRQVQVTSANNDTAATVAGLVNTALNTDATYASTVSANIVTATNSIGGALDDPDAGTSGFVLAVTQQGQALSSTIVYNGSASDLQDGLDDFWVVTQSGDDYILECSVVGAQPAFVIEESELIYPNGVDGALNINTVRFAEAFGETDQQSLDLVFEIVLQLAGELTQVVYQQDVTVFASVVDPTGGVPPSVLSSGAVLFRVGLTPGSSLVEALFPSVLSGVPTKILVSLNPPAGGDPMIVGAYATVADRCQVMVGGGGAPGANYWATVLASV